jgi:amino-transferase class IV
MDRPTASVHVCSMCTTPTAREVRPRQRNEHRWVEELGGMNVFLVMGDGSLVTPPLSGTILPGITRDAIITLARKQGRTVREERYSMDQWRTDAASGKLKEAFACGTAAVVASIGKIKSSAGDIVIADGSTGPVTAATKAKLVGIQRGDIADEFGCAGSASPGEWSTECPLLALLSPCEMSDLSPQSGPNRIAPGSCARLRASSQPSGMASPMGRSWIDSSDANDPQIFASAGRE